MIWLLNVKILFSLVLLFLVSYESSALSNQSAINQYLKNKKLDKLEGIWYSPPDNYWKRCKYYYL
jgi:hypothetical protein